MSSCAEAGGYVVVSLAAGWRLVTPEERAELGAFVGGLIGHYAGEAACDMINDQGVDRVAEAMV